MDKRFSILYSLNRCAICGKTSAETKIFKHEVFFGTANRENSIKYGCVCGLCFQHHDRRVKGSVHDEPLGKYDLQLKKDYETAFIIQYSFEQFMAVFHRNYLEDDELYYAQHRKKELEESYHISKGKMIGNK